MAGQQIPGSTCVTHSAPIDEGTLCLAATPAPGSTGLGTPDPARPEDGMQVILTPLQMAAVLQGESLEPPATLSARLWGGATVIGGALELVGAAALLLTPEPTALTKIAGGALGVHGSDTAATGLRQMISGRPESTLTAEAARSAAAALGVDEKNAAMIGMSVDIGIPLILGFAGAVRVLAIRRGAISLAAEEVAGGHTLARHVGQTEFQLRARLAAEPRISAASTFRTLADAERAVADGLRANQAAIKAWAKTATAGQSKAITYNAGRAIGFGVLRATPTAQQMTRLTIVIRRVQSADRVYFVLTAFPKP